jgi:spore germination cell wall hydrolase CwlJ-like protein
MTVLATLEAIRKALLSGRVIDDEELATLTIWMEARGESQEGRTAVAEVIRNRAKKKTVAEVVLAPYQFSCWNTQDPNRIKAAQLHRNDALYLECLAAWKAAATTNLTKGATHYFNPKTANPSWKALGKKTATIGSHDFYTML